MALGVARGALPCTLRPCSNNGWAPASSSERASWPPQEVVPRHACVLVGGRTFQASVPLLVLLARVRRGGTERPREVAQGPPTRRKKRPRCISLPAGQCSACAHPRPRHATRSVPRRARRVCLPRGAPGWCRLGHRAPRRRRCPEVCETRRTPHTALENLPPGARSVGTPARTCSNQTPAPRTIPNPPQPLLSRLPPRESALSAALFVEQIRQLFWGRLLRRAPEPHNAQTKGSSALRALHAPSNLRWSWLPPPLLLNRVCDTRPSEGFSLC